MKSIHGHQSIVVSMGNSVHSFHAIHHIARNFAGAITFAERAAILYELLTSPGFRREHHVDKFFVTANL